MTRRNFIKQIILAGLGTAAGVWAFTRKAVKKFVRAEKAENYPGPIKQLTNIDNMSKWSG
jgi:hypothetical protein